MLPAEPEPTLPPTEFISRFSTSSGEYRKTGPEAKTKLFMPPENGPLEVSSFHTTGLLIDEIAAIGDLQITQVSGRRVHGHGSLTVSDVTDIGLLVHYDNIPPRHANIKGWSSEKSVKLQRAQELAAKVNSRASFCLY